MIEDKNKSSDRKIGNKRNQHGPEGIGDKRLVFGGYVWLRNTYKPAGQGRCRYKRE